MTEQEQGRTADDDGVDAVEWKPAELDTGLSRAKDQTIGQPTGEQARELDSRLREFEELRRRGEATSHAVYIGATEADRG